MEEKGCLSILWTLKEIVIIDFLMSGVDKDMKRIRDDIDIFSIILPTGEISWKIKDSLKVLECLKNHNKIVLGGDILNDKQKYTYDNWFYDVELTKSREENLLQSIKVAQNYLSEYIDCNGDNYYVVIICL